MSGGGHPDSPSRAIMLALALLAITFDFLQPLVHAAAMRDAAPRSLWSVLCNASAADPDKTGTKKDDGGPVATVDHDCCIGLAHAQTAVAPPLVFVALAPVATALVALRELDHSANLGIRDGPNQPRAPPLSFA